jgi:hypothetical protein
MREFFVPFLLFVASHAVILGLAAQMYALAQ